MDIFAVFTLLGGLAIFLFGMNVMGENLEKSSGGRLKTILESMTSNRFKGVLLGAGVTAIIQSSSATTTTSGSTVCPALAKHANKAIPKSTKNLFIFQ